jgi:hypothetical protein
MLDELMLGNAGVIGATVYAGSKICTRAKGKRYGTTKCPARTGHLTNKSGDWTPKCPDE